MKMALSGSEIDYTAGELVNDYITGVPDFVGKKKSTCILAITFYFKQHGSTIYNLYMHTRYSRCNL